MKSPFFAVAALALFVQSCDQNHQPVAKTAQAAEEVLPPVAMITGATTAPVGQAVKISYANSVFHKAKWYVDTSGVIIPGNGNSSLRDQAERLKNQGYKVEAPNEDAEVYFTCGEMLILSSYPGSVYRVTLAVTNEVGDVDVVGHVVTIAGSPEPPPDDDPPPDTGYGLAAKVPSWVATISVSGQAAIPAVKAALLKQAGNCAEGKFNTLDEVETSLLSLLSPLVSSGGWTGFGNAFNAATNELKTSGKVTTPQQMGEVYEEIAGAM